MRVDPDTDFPDRFARGARVWVNEKPHEVQVARWALKALLLKLTGVDDRGAAEALKGTTLTAEARPDLGENAYYQHDIVGMTAYDREGVELGRVTEIFPTGSNDVYVVSGAKGQLLLPAIDDVVLEIDVAAQRMTVEVIEGLEWEKPVGRHTVRRDAKRVSPPKSSP